MIIAIVFLSILIIALLFFSVFVHKIWRYGSYEEYLQHASLVKKHPNEMFFGGEWNTQLSPWMLILRTCVIRALAIIVAGIVTFSLYWEITT